MSKVRVVAGLLMDRRKRLLCCRRKDKGDLALKWVLPGGKIKARETHKQALKRELKEELEIDAVIGKHFITVEHKYDTFRLTMYCYLIDDYYGDIKLHDHNCSLWIDFEDLPYLNWAEADWPIVNKLCNKEVS